MQNRKQAFLDAARSKGNNYLPSTRTAPLSAYEIKAGWEIPAVLEQALNSDLPGELKALVTSNVYDTATGQHMLIPQGLAPNRQVRFSRRIWSGWCTSRVGPHHFPRRFVGRS